MTVYYIVFPLFSFVSTMDIENVETMQMFIMEFFLEGGGHMLQSRHIPWNSWTSNQYWFRLCTKCKCYYKSGLSGHICVDLCVYKSRTFPCICLLVCLCSTQRNDCKCMKTHLGFLEEVLFGYLSYRVQMRTKILFSHSYCLSSQGWLMLWQGSNNTVVMC